MLDCLFLKKLMEISTLWYATFFAFKISCFFASTAALSIVTFTRSITLILSYWGLFLSLTNQNTRLTSIILWNHLLMIKISNFEVTSSKEELKTSGGSWFAIFELSIKKKALRLRRIETREWISKILIVIAWMLQ